MNAAFRQEARARTVPSIAACGPAGAVPPAWHVVWTQSQCERLVDDQLAARGFETFLPGIDVWSWRAGLRHLIRRPMFPGYLFLRHALDKSSWLEVRRTRGVVGLLGESWERPAVVPEWEIDSVRLVTRSGLPCMPHAHLKEGSRVRVRRGPLAGVEGILARRADERGLLVLSVDLLSRSVAVEIDCTAVEPA